jgi:hypothetical protein
MSFVQLLLLMLLLFDVNMRSQRRLAFCWRLFLGISLLSSGKQEGP